ncbi:hypothetical protein PV326_010649 [Microctonus aethiopoides]|nr:hypothetical protein PV326_010649 [Microctonus aethiopoides]
MDFQLIYKVNRKRKREELNVYNEQEYTETSPGTNAELRLPPVVVIQFNGREENYVFCFSVKYIYSKNQSTITLWDNKKTTKEQRTHKFHCMKIIDTNFRALFLPEYSRNRHFNHESTRNNIEQQNRLIP